MNKMILCGLMAAVLSGCVSATVTEPSLCDTSSLGSVPASPVAGIVLPPHTFTDTFDFSQTIDKVTDVANQLTIDVNQLTVDGNDMSWVTGVIVSIQGSGDNTPEAQLATFTSNGTQDQSVPLTVTMDSDTLLSYLESGPITLSVEVTGTAPLQPVTMTNTLCVMVSGSFSKSL